MKKIDAWWASQDRERAYQEWAAFVRECLEDGRLLDEQYGIIQGNPLSQPKLRQRDRRAYRVYLDKSLSLQKKIRDVYRSCPDISRAIEDGFLNNILDTSSADILGVL